MAYVAFSASRQGASAKTAGVLPQREWALCRYDTRHHYVDGTKGLVITRRQGWWLTWSAVTRIRQLFGARC